MAEGNFDLFPFHDAPENSRQKIELRELASHYWDVREKLGDSFPIYRAMQEKYAGQDILPFTKGNGSIGEEPKSPEEALRYLLSREYTLVGIAWQHATHNFNNDPTISWTTDREFARTRAERLSKALGNASVVIQANGSALPFGVSQSKDLQPNFVIHIPTLARIRGAWPSEQSPEENEAVTFGVFPVDKYKVIEEIK